MSTEGTTFQTNTGEAEKAERKKNLENTCKKIMAFVSPCLCILLIIGYIFRGSADARSLRNAFRSEGFDVRLVTDSDDVKDALRELNPNIKNVNEFVVATDKDDKAVYVIVLFCESRLDAADVQDEILSWLSLDSNYTVERNAKAVCFGYVDLVEMAMEILN